MKRFIPYIALMTLIVVVGCSGDSPRAKPAPTVVPDSWSIVSLTVSDTSPYVGAPILVEAEVTVNGAAAPDGTTVKFSASGPGQSYGFTQGTLTKADIALSKEASVVTEDGFASVLFLVAQSDDASGSYLIQAQVRDAVRQVSVSYVGRPSTDALQLYSINPNRGSYAGGQVSTILGKGILAPVEVYFDLNGIAYPAQIVEVVDSAPEASDIGSITVVTPTFSGADSSIEQAADVRVNSLGSGVPDSDTLPQAFHLLPGLGLNVYGVVPNSGRAAGGEIVTVLGQGFGSNPADLTVSFIWSATDPNNPEDTDQVVFGRVLSVDSEGTQIQVETPRFFGSAAPPNVDVVTDVKVSGATGTATAFRSFVVIAENPTPAIASISPIAGPFDGGTLVTIFGSGFRAPMQVTFGDLTALDVNVFDDTTPANNDRIECVTPDYSQQDVVPPFAADVTVTNVTSGQTDTLPGAFTFGDPLYITGNSPVEGGLGDLVIIYGSGFEDPLQVFLGNDLMELVSVSGTELVVRVPDDLATQCSGRSASFRVVLLESGLEASGGNFTISGNTPTVLSVSPVILQEDGAVPSNVVPDAVTIIGQGFSDEVLVNIGTFVVPSTDVDRTSSTTIDVQNIPGPGDLGVSFNTSPCTTGTGQTGQRLAATPVEVTVTNFPGNCPDSLPGAIVVEPFDTTCVVASGIGLSTLTFPPTEQPGPSPGQVLTISETTGASDLTVNSLSLTGRFFFDAGCTQQGAAGFVVPAGTGNSSISVYFCPDTDNGAPYVGNLTVLSSAPSSPSMQSLNGQEAYPIMGVTPQNLNFAAAGEVQNFQISNTGTSVLNWTASETSDPDDVYSFAPMAGSINPGDPAVVVAVTLSGGAASGAHSGDIEVSSSDPDAQGSPVTVTLNANVP
jgi:hypothetical protein